MGKYILNWHTQCPHNESLTPSTQLIWLWFIERTRLLALSRLGAWLGFGGTGYGQRLGLGVPFASRLVYHLAHQHRAFPVVWGEVNPPA